MSTKTNISGHTKLMCVIGHPIEHSLSPKLHTAFAEAAGVDALYLAFDITPEKLQDFVISARTLDIIGFNITMPLKEHILTFLDELDPLAERCRAVNTVANRNGKLIGYNTDAEGFIPSLNGYAPKNALILGSGGVAKAASVALEQFGSTVRNVSLRTEWNILQELAASTDLIVNATPLGMTDNERFRNFDFLAHTSATVYDLVYYPRETDLLKAASKHGLNTIGGIELFRRQALLAFEKFTGVKADHRIFNTI
jgi:shikimate dehydrogenase